MDNAAAYLRSRGEIAHDVSELGGGVSNTVLLVQTESARYVLKQALSKLRVEQPWFAGRDRIFREAAALETAASILPAGAVPSVAFLDRENYILAIAAAPAGALTWKQLLFAGDVDPGVAETCGTLLGTLISGSRRSSSLAAQFGDPTAFIELRIEPYYRVTAERHPDLAPAINALIERCLANQYSLVHGDWSPKNLLVSNGRVIAIDFEVVHFGDPTFDSAFLLTHLLLKSRVLPDRAGELRHCARAFWRALIDTLPPDATAWFESCTVEHLGALLLARVDGKSPAEYLSDPGLKLSVRELGRSLLLRPIPLAEVFEW